MIRFPFKLIICVSCLSGSLICTDVRQTPADVMRLPDESVTLTCNHSINNYYTILWYQKTHGDSSLKLIGYVYYAKVEYEKNYEGNFTLTGNGGSSVSLQISKARQVPHSALYFCAASTGGFADLKFGPGTKLTVLDPNVTITSPSINLLPPSHKEICYAKKEGVKVTLVCLATDFYPDHINITWKVNGKDRKYSVATDQVAQQDPDTRLYIMSSRLSVNLTEWTNIKNKFTCIIHFYDGNDYEKIQQTIRFIPDKIPVWTFVSVRFGYLMFLGKSLLYAAFVSIVVWKCRATKEKTLMTEDGDMMIS